MKEIWKPIRNYEGLYEVSNMGRVKSLERTAWNGKGYWTMPEKILRAVNNGNGYLAVNLYKEGIMKTYKIHRLVATAFLPNSNNLPCINHKDENKQNNCVDNLEFCSYSYNNTYNDKAKKASKKIAEKNCKPVYGINKVSGLIIEFKSAKEAGRTLRIDPGSITKCCKGKKYKSAGGFYWHYASESEEVCDE